MAERKGKPAGTKYTGTKYAGTKYEGQVQTVRVELAAQPYDILIGEGILQDCGPRAAATLPGARLCVVTDEHVAKLYLRDVMASLEAAGLVCLPPIILPAGEETKNFSQLQHILDRALDYRLDRRSAFVALGGGVVGDITGFAASILLRGIPYIQIPTTLLAQVDSSVGGKTAINTKQGKNLVGAFHQPKLVLIDTVTLTSLPERDVKAGYAEILKYGLIDDPAFFNWLEQNGKKVLARDSQALAEAVRASCAAKARVVAADEKEQKDIRALLNLGHTFGHALETIYKYDGRLLHGEAVGIGTKMAFDFSAELGLCPAAEAATVTRHMKDLDLLIAPPVKVSPTEMLEKMRGDKKAAGGKLTLILVRSIGKAYVARDIEEKTLAGFLERNCG